MKKKLLLSMLAFFCLVGGSAWAQTFTQGNLKFTVIDAGARTVSVEKANDNITGALVLPSTVANEGVTYTVTTVVAYAFENTDLTSITIPASVESLAERAFASCASLSNVRIEDSEQPLKLWNGYWGTFAYSDHEMTGYIGRDVQLNNDGDPIFSNPTSVEFGDKVTRINSNLFYDRSNLQSVTIGKGVKEIGNGAFLGCGDNTETVAEMLVTLGENIKTIGRSAFDGCITLKSITLPEKLDTIFGYAFQNTGLTSITIPASVDSLAERAFGSCASLSNVRIEDSEQPLKLWNGYWGTFAYSDHEMTGYIGRDLQFNGIDPVFGNPTSIEIGDKVTFINNNLFNDRDNLQSVTIGKGVKAIGEYAFTGAGDNTETVAEMLVTLGENIETIGRSAFDGCITLKSITLPEKLDTIFAYAFQNTGLTSITIPASVDSLAERAFGSCGSLTNIRIEDSEQPLKAWNGYYGTFAYSDAEKTVYVGRDLVLNDETTVFGNPTSVVFGDNVTTINPKMFSDNSKLASVTIGKGVKNIGYSAFYNCGNDESVTNLAVTMGTGVETIGNNAFDLCKNMKAITLPATLTTIGETTFASTGLTTISIPASVTSIGTQAFGWNSLTSITFEDGDQPLTMENGYYGTFRNPQADYTLYLGRNIETENKDNSPFPNVTVVTIGPKVTNLQQRLFYDRDKLITVTGGENVETMGSSVYCECNNLERISPLGKNLKVLPESTFELCEKLDGIVLPNGLEEIQQWAFHRCYALTELTIPGSVKVMGTKPDGGDGYRVFYENTAMRKLVFADSNTPLKYIETNNNGGYCRGMSNLEKLYIGRDIVKGEGSVDQNLFVSGANIEFGPSVTEIGTNLADITATSVKAPWMKPIAITDNAFKAATYSGATLWLPGGAREAYAEADGWKNFVNVEFASYVVSVEATQGGSLTMGNITVANGEKAQTLVDRGSAVTFSVQPEQNYDFASLTVNGEAVNVENNTYTYPQLLTDINVKATFTEKPKFDIKATATGGTVSLNDAQPSASQSIKVYRDTDVTLAIAAAEGYENPKVTVNGQDVTAQLRNNKLTLRNIQEAKTIVVTYAKKTFRVVAANVQNGSIQLSQTTVEWGGSFTATFKPATGYEFATASVNGVDVTAQVQNNVLTVTDVKEAKTVSATFKKLKFEIAKQTTQNGTITLSQTTVEWGDSFKATFTPATGYELATATVNGVDFTANVVNNVLTVTNVQENKTVGATFQKQTYSVSISGAGISVSTTTPKYGDNVTVTIDNDPDRTLVSLLVNGQDVTAQVVNGQYIIRNVTGNVTIEATFRSTKEFITMTDEYAVFSCPQDLDFSESNLCAYIVSGVNKNTHQVLMTRVFDVPAGTGLYLIGTPGQTYKIPYSESYSIYKNFLVANLTKSSVSATTGSYTNYAFGTEDGEPGFYPISGSTTLLAQTAYLQLPTSFVEAGVKMSIILEEDLIDGIEDFRISDSEETIYDLAGRRLSKTQKGINIVNGKKILK